MMENMKFITGNELISMKFEDKSAIEELLQVAKKIENLLLKEELYTDYAWDVVEIVVEMLGHKRDFTYHKDYEDFFESKITAKELINKITGGITNE